RVLPKILRGTQQGDRAVLMRTARSIQIEATDQRSLFFHLDGELREPPEVQRLDIEVVPAALPVLTAAAP
ncbi:MAG TPA: hypothetical protein VK864_07470, partial [Longimicrobiales bacterium]|nr:hypothetical protein [Longimicrobiales bacterium]